MFFIVK